MAGSNRLPFGRVVIIAVVAAAAIGAAVTAHYMDGSLGVAVPPSPQPGTGTAFPALGFEYSEMNAQLKDVLGNEGILMSSPIKITAQPAIGKYCTFFDDPQKQAQVEYCTSTELRDADSGQFLGNIHMVGDSHNPKLLMAVLETGDGQTGMVETVFEAVIDSAVCRCWGELLPGGFVSPAKWIYALDDFHRQAPATHTTSKSAVLQVDGFKLQSEVTTTGEHTLVWKILVAA